MPDLVSKLGESDSEPADHQLELSPHGKNGADSPLHGRCGAQLRRRPGKYCKRYPMAGKKRCPIHGGKSTGPRTPEGRAKSLSKLKRKAPAGSERRLLLEATFLELPPAPPVPVDHDVHGGSG